MTATQEPPAVEDTAEAPTEHVDVLIVGSGFSGLGMAVRLKQEGNDDFVVLERREEVGGTWWDNTYPGCACDVPSHLYSFSFALNPNWSSTYSKRPEIAEYLRDTADRFGIRPHLRLGREVTAATWDEDAGRWTVESSGGTLTARVLVMAVGPLSEPKTASLAGLENFKGPVFHSAQWNHEHDFAGERVASIGTGASAIQFVPEIQPQVEKLTVFQRTPPWVFPHTDRPITNFEQRLYRRFPFVQRLVRGLIYGARETLVLGFVKNPKLLKQLERLGKRHIRKQIPDPELRRQVTPDYAAGCKRILPSNKWYPALMQPNVELVAEGVEEVRERSVVTPSGREVEVDTIVLGTGFNVYEMPAARGTRGRDGRLLSEEWKDGPRAHLGTTVPGFPNMFLLLGPNTGLGHNSMVYMIESQLAYVMDALNTLRSRNKAWVEPRPEVTKSFNAEVDRDLESTVWNSGCASWYIDESGRNSTLWPDWTWRYRQRTAHFDPAEHVMEGTPAEPARAAA